MKIINRTVCLWIMNGDDVLMVNPRHRDEVCLPLGRVDTGEDEVVALIREMYERFGLELHPAILIPLYVGPHSDMNDNSWGWVTVYVAYTGEIQGELQSNDPAIIPRWIPFSEVGGSHTLYPDFHAKVKEAWKQFVRA